MFIYSTLFQSILLGKVGPGVTRPFPITTLGQKGRSFIGKKVYVSPKKKFFIF